MFNNPGRKIQTLAKIVFWLIIAVVALVVYGLINTLPANEYSIIRIVVIIIGGIVFAWLSTIFMYGIGTLIENIAFIREELEIQGNNQDEEIQKIDTVLQLLQSILIKIHDNGEQRTRERIADKMENVFRE